MQVLMLAGGRGTRMGDMTKTVQKTMIDVRGKPVLQYQIEFFKRQGITDILLSVGYLKEQVMEFFGDGSRFGVKIDYVVEDEPLGTAGPIRLAAKKIRGTFVMINADTLIDAKVTDVVKFHKEAGAPVTVMLVKSDETKSRGMVKMSGDRISEFVEKPDEDTLSYINGGLYVMEPEIVNFVPEGFCMLEKDVFPKLAADGKLAGWTGDARIMDMGTPDRLKKTREDWK